MVSLDSENADWLSQHMSLGNLPNLAALARSGVTFPVEPAALFGMVYPTLYTGQRTADLGYYFPLQWNAEQQRVMECYQRPFPQTLFERADHAGKRMVILDPPEAPPIHLNNGFCASGIQFRARILLSSWSTNETRSSQLMRTLGPAPRADEVFGQNSVADRRYLRSKLLMAPARLEAAALEFLRHDPPDCLWVTCCALHVSAHQFFHLPSIRDSQVRATLEGTRLELARGYDRMLGSLMDKLPAGSRILVGFAKGMDRAIDWSDLLPNMLARVLGQEASSPPASLLRRFIPRSIRRWVGSSLTDRQAVDMMARLSSPRANWARTRAFCLPTDSPGFIQCNLAGREREGIVHERDLPELRQEIAAGLRSFTDFEGNPCVESVLTPAEVVGEGREVHRLPDLIVRWNQIPGATSKGVRSPRFGEIRRTAEAVGRSGHHRPGAFAILAGGKQDAIPPGQSMRVEDIPATLLAAMDLPIEDVPGRSFWPSEP